LTRQANARCNVKQLSATRPLRLSGEVSGATVLEVLDRVLDKGIVIDSWLRLSVGGIELVTVEARVVVASIEMYLQHTERSWPGR
jgi:hypothetical protein